MVNSFCKAEDYQQILNVRENVSIIRFSKEPIMEPVYEGEGEDMHPTGEYVDSGLVKFTEETVIGELTPEKIIDVRLHEVDVYDASEDVNLIFVNGKPMWFDKVTRTCISYSMQIEKEAGNVTTTLYDNDGTAYVLPIDDALNMFGAVELYAKACYNKTQEHKDNLKALTTVQEALDYNIKTGYPEKLQFTTPQEGE
jgi:hypothetical protein